MFIATLALLIAMCRLSVAQAQTDEIQVYDAEIAEPGVFNLTWHNNYTPDGGKEAAFPGGIVPDHDLNGVPEWAYGVAPWMEAGLYFPLYSLTSKGALTFNGFKLRTLFVSPNAAERMFFYGLNFEFSYNTAHWDENRYSQEMRPIFGWHLGAVDIVINPILDNNYKGLGKLDFAPASRVAYNLNKQWAIAAEEYDDFGHIDGFNPSNQQQHQLFGVFDFKGAVWSVEGGAGVGLNSATDRLVLKLILSRDLNRPAGE
jgi:hypothetical protein